MSKVMSKVGIMVDSTCDLTVEELGNLNVELVALRVSFGDETFLDAIEMTTPQFYERLARSDELPKTSQPSPAQYRKAYENLVAQGCDGIVSLSLSSALSGSYEASRLMAKGLSIPVYCIDTKSVTQGLGLIVRAACALRDEGMDSEEIAEKVRVISAKTSLLFIIDTMDNLVKGGRAGLAAGLAASLLDIKPILTLDEQGVITPFKRCRGRKKAVAELAKYVSSCSKRLGPLDYTLIYTTDRNDIEILREALNEAGVDGREVHTGSNGPVIGTYVPQACGVAFYPQKWSSPEA
ncbi:MAG: DegV family protein [Coriobacteriia bacterium]|nr:DegV family protein [Coriobacteriia bacterium]